MGAEAAAHRAQVSPEVERLRFASFANVVVVGAVECPLDLNPKTFTFVSFELENVPTTLEAVP